MKYASVAALLSVLILVPNLASAHEVQHFMIGGEEYMFVVGSLNEPITVDDKTGVDLTISEVHGAGAAAEDHHAAGGEVSGLEESLKVEISAGDQKKVMDLSPVYGKPGSYKTTFYPTVATTYTYRVFGEIEGTPVDLPFTCSTKGHGEAEEDTTEVKISEGVTRTLKTGAFSCPAEKADLGFPEVTSDVQTLKNETGTAKTVAFASLALTLIMGGYVLSRKR